LAQCIAIIKFMKSSLLSVTICLLFCINSYAQYGSNYDYTIAPRVYSIMQMPKVFNQNTQRYIGTYIKGGTVKFNDNQISIRMTGYYLNQRMQFTDDCSNCELADGKVADYAFKIGFEKNLSYAKLQPYFGIDIGYRNNAFKGKMSAVNIDKTVVAMNSIESTKNGFTAAPLAGIKFNILPVLTLFAEGSLEFFYSYERRQTVTLDAAAQRTFNKTYQTDFLLNPLVLGLQFHLSRKD
jgi:hypothetical protein